MRSAHESFLLAEARQRIAEGECRAKHAEGLTELRRSRPTLRQRVAGLLVALAYRLSPEIAPFSESVKGCVQA
jgi:hypothetical protein